MNLYCFIRDNETVFKLVKIVERSSDGTLTVADTEKPAAQQRVKEDATIAVGSIEELENPPSDLIKLNYVHPAGILHTLRSRFQKDLIYTSIGPILVALNPFKWIGGIYDADVKEKYKSRQFNLSENPHVFATANDSFTDLQFGQNQSLIISGESGAGKTEATKQCLSYLAYIAGSEGGIQEKILKASPILEAWGNAKTLRNNNSSRFGKFIEVWFDSQQQIVGSSNTTYLLEKSRVVRQDKDERNYHVFYQLLQGGSTELLKEFLLVPSGGAATARADLQVFHYINQSGCITIHDVDDAKDFQDANSAFDEIGFRIEDRQALYRIVAGILNLGNITFAPNVDEARIDESAELFFRHAVKLFGVDLEAFRQALLFRKIQSGGGKRKSIAFAPYTPAQAMDNKDALSKEIYRRCFDWIVSEINRLMYSSEVKVAGMLGILDIFGFEIFQKNSFEQLCINLANEALQQHFNYNIFQAEMDIYLQEDVPVPKLDFKDNQDVLDLIMKRPKGLIPMLDEEGLVPRGSWEGFVSKFSKQHNSHPRFKFKNKTNELGIVHYAGEVYYDPSFFLIKNKDTLSNDFIELLPTSSATFLAALFDESLIIRREQSIGSFRQDVIINDPNNSKLAAMSTKLPTSSASTTDKQTVGKKFSLQLESLMNTLNVTKPRYIRCIKPNQQKLPNIFVHHLTNEQLTYSGVFEAVVIMQNGYPFRKDHLEFRRTYGCLITSSKLRRLIFDEDLFQSVYAQLISTSRGDSYYDQQKKTFRCTLSVIDTLSKHFQRPKIIPASAGASSNKSNVGEIKTKSLFPLTRDQCVLMIYLISLYHSEIHTSQLYVGRTKIFYRATEHILLIDIRQRIMQLNSIALQRFVRGYIIRKLIAKGILPKEKECIKAIQSRCSIPTLRNHVDILLDFERRILKVCSNQTRDNGKSKEKVSLATKLNQNKSKNSKSHNDANPSTQNEQKKNNLNMPMIKIAKEYCDTLIKEETCMIQLEKYWKDYDALFRTSSNDKSNKKELFKPSPFDLKEKEFYKSLAECMMKAKEIEFQSSYKGVSLALFWKDNKTFVQFETYISKLGHQIQLKEQYQQGIAEKNEFILEECGKMLSTLQSQGILPNDFAKEYEEEAKVIQKNAKELYENLLTQSVAALSIGTFQATKVLNNPQSTSANVEASQSSATHYSLSITVDASSLQQVLMQYESTITSTKQQPFKCKLLLNTIKQVINIRGIAKQQQWQKIWESYDNLWSPSFQSTAPSKPITQEVQTVLNPKEFSSFLEGKLLFIPEEFYTKLHDEVKLMIVTALTFLLIPKFHQILKKLSLPLSTLFVDFDNRKVYSINTKELEEQLKIAKDYEHYFNEDLQQFLALSNEQCFVRKAITQLGEVMLIHTEISSSTEPSSPVSPSKKEEKENLVIGKLSVFTAECITAAIQQLKYLPPSHPEHQYLLQYQQLFISVLPKIFKTIRAERWRGKKGYFQASDIKIDGMKKIILLFDQLSVVSTKDVTTSLPNIQGKAWEELMLLGKSIYQIRLFLLKNQLKECKDYFFSKVVSSQLWEEMLSKYVELDNKKHKSHAKQSLIFIKKKKKIITPYTDSSGEKKQVWIQNHSLQDLFYEIVLECNDYLHEIFHQESVAALLKYFKEGALIPQDTSLQNQTKVLPTPHGQFQYLHHYEGYENYLMTLLDYLLLEYNVESSHFISQSKAVMQIRIAYVKEDWETYEKYITEWQNSSVGFTSGSIHPDCSDEFQYLYHYYMNYACRKRLENLFQNVKLPISEIGGIQTHTDWKSFENIAHYPYLLLQVIHDYDKYSIYFNSYTRVLIFYAKFLYLFFTAYFHNYFEPFAWFSLGRNKTSGILPDILSGSEKKHITGESIEKLIAVYQSPKTLFPSFSSMTKQILKLVDLHMKEESTLIIKPPSALNDKQIEGSDRAGAKKKPSKKSLTNELLSLTELGHYHKYLLNFSMLDDINREEDSEVQSLFLLLREVGSVEHKQINIFQTHCLQIIHDIKTELFDRHHRIVLLIAGLTNRCTGSIDSLKCELIEIKYIEKALQFVAFNCPEHVEDMTIATVGAIDNNVQLHKITKYYYKVIKHLCKIRSTIYSANIEYEHAMKVYLDETERMKQLKTNEDDIILRRPVKVDDCLNEYFTLEELKSLLNYIDSSLSMEDVPQISTPTAATVISYDMEDITNGSSKQVSDAQLLLKTILFPSEEILLYYQRVHDLYTFEELLVSTSHGQCAFQDNTFDVSRVDYEHLLERLEPIKRSALPHSDRVDRCLFFLELVINLRKAVVYNLWDLSTSNNITSGTKGAKGSENTPSVSTSMSVKRCLFEYKQALKFFARNSMHNIPSEGIQQEFQVVEREWQRRLLLHKFTALFQKGCISGKPFDLSFSSINIELLLKEILAIESWEKQIQEKDHQMEIYMTAARELIGLRQEAMRIQNTYLLPDIQFSEYSIHTIEDYDVYPARNSEKQENKKYYHSLQACLHQSNYLSSIISCAVDKVSLLSTKYSVATSAATVSNSSNASYLLQEMSKMRTMLLKVHAIHELPFHVDEVELLQMDIGERMYVSEVCQFFYQVSGIVKSLPAATREDLLQKRVINGTNYSYMIGSSSSASRTSTTSATAMTPQQLIVQYQKSYDKLTNSIDELMYSLKLYMVRQEKVQSFHAKKMAKAKESGKGGYQFRKKNTYQPSYILEYLHNSVVILLHYYRAKFLNYYEYPVNRSWLTEDTSNSTLLKLSVLKQSIQQLITTSTLNGAPTSSTKTSNGSSNSSITSMLTTTNVKYTINSLIKVNKKYGYAYHPQVKAILEQEEALIEKWISEDEVLNIATSSSYQIRGEVGNIKYPFITAINVSSNYSESNEKLSDELVSASIESFDGENNVLPAMKLVLTRLEFMYPQIKYTPLVVSSTHSSTNVPFGSAKKNSKLSDTNASHQILNDKNIMQLNDAFVILIRNIQLLYHLRKTFMAHQYTHILNIIQDFFQLKPISTSGFKFEYFYHLFHNSPTTTHSGNGGNIKGPSKPSVGSYFFNSPQLLFGHEEILLILNESCDQLFIQALYHDLLQYHLHGDLLQICIWSLAKEKLGLLMNIANAYLVPTSNITVGSGGSELMPALWKLDKSTTLGTLLDVSDTVLQIRTILLQLTQPPNATQNQNSTFLPMFPNVSQTYLMSEKKNFEDQVLSQSVRELMEQGIQSALQQINKSACFNWQWNNYLPLSSNATSGANNLIVSGNAVGLYANAVPAVSSGNLTIQTLQSLLDILSSLVTEKHSAYFSATANGQEGLFLKNSLIEDYQLIKSHISFILSYAPLEQLYVCFASSIQYTTNGLILNVSSSGGENKGWDFDKIDRYILDVDELLQCDMQSTFSMEVKSAIVNSSTLDETSATSDSAIGKLRRRSSISSILTSLHYAITTAPNKANKPSLSSRLSKRQQEGRKLMKFYFDDFVDLIKSFFSLCRKCYASSQPLPNTSTSTINPVVSNSPFVKRAIFPGTKDFMEIMSCIRGYLTQYEEILQKVKSIKGYGKRSFPPQVFATTTSSPYFSNTLSPTPNSSTVPSGNFFGNANQVNLVTSMNNGFLLALQEHANILVIKQVITSEELYVDEDFTTGKINFFVYQKNIVSLLGKSFQQFANELQLSSKGTSSEPNSSSQYYKLYVDNLLAMLSSNIAQTSKIQQSISRRPIHNKSSLIASAISTPLLHKSHASLDDGYSLFDYTKALLVFRQEIHSLHFRQALKYFPSIIPISEYGVWTNDQYIFANYLQLLTCQRYFDYALYLILQCPDIILWTLAEYIWIFEVTPTTTTVLSRHGSILGLGTNEHTDIAKKTVEKKGNAMFLLKQMIQQLEDALEAIETYYSNYQPPFSISLDSIPATTVALQKNKQHVYEYKLFQFYRQLFKLWQQLLYAILSGWWISVPDIQHALQSSNNNAMGNGFTRAQFQSQQNSILLPSTVQAMKPVVISIASDISDREMQSVQSVNNSGNTVYRNILKLQSFLVQNEMSFPQYLLNHMHAELSKYEQELIYIQYEQYLQSTLQLIQCQGQPGELFVTACQDALIQLSYVLERLGMSMDISSISNSDNNGASTKGKSSKLLQQGWLSAKIFLGILSTYQLQQWKLLGQYVIILRYLTSTNSIYTSTSEPPGKINRESTGLQIIQRTDLKAFPTSQDKEYLFQVLFADQIDFEGFLQHKPTLYSPIISSSTALQKDCSEDKMSIPVEPYPEAPEIEIVPSSPQSTNSSKSISSKISNRTPTRRASTVKASLPSPIPIGTSSIRSQSSVMANNTPATTKSDALLLEQACQTCLQLSSNDLLTFYPLRKELISFTSLFHHDFLLTTYYQEFLRALTEQPALGVPGELETTTIKYSLCENITKGMIQFQIPFADGIGHSAFLFHACETLMLIRKGQYLGQLDVISQGITLAKEWLLKEFQYHPLAIPSPFVVDSTLKSEDRNMEKAFENSHEEFPVQNSAIPYYSLHTSGKQFLMLAQQEILIAEEDLQQKSLIKQLKDALQSFGVPDSEYPFSLKMIEIDALEEVINLATGSTNGSNKSSSGKQFISPKSKHAQDLLSTVKIIYKLRSLVIKRFWKEILEFIPTIYSQENEVFIAPVVKNLEEVFAAWKIATISSAIDLAYLGYSSGRIYRDLSVNSNISELVPKELINIEVLTKAKQQFNEIPNEEWKNTKVCNHEYSVEKLLSLRQAYLAKEYEKLFEIIQELQLQIQTGEQALINQCREEVAFLDQHCMYVIVSTSLSQALAHNGISGSFGKKYLKVDELSLSDLKKSFLSSFQMIVSHENIRRLQRSVVLLYRIRKAVLLNKWTSSSYLLQENLHIVDHLVLDTSNMNAVAAVTHINAVVEKEVETPKKVERKVFTLGGLFDGSDEDAENSPVITETVDNQNISSPIMAWEKKYFPPEYHEDETVEELLENRFEEFQTRSSDYNIEIIFKEVEIVYQEMKFRQIIAKLLEGIYSPGFCGVPGDIRGAGKQLNHQPIGFFANALNVGEDVSSVSTAVLEESISFALQFPSISSHSQCEHLLRDVQLLYRCRSAKLNQDYVVLQDSIQQAEEINQLAFESQIRLQEEEEEEEEDEDNFKMEMEVQEAKGNVDDGSIHSQLTESIEGEFQKSVKSVLPIVWDEIKLFKFDLCFQIALFEFAAEMKKEEILFPEKKALRRKKKMMKEQQHRLKQLQNKSSKLVEGVEVHTSDEEKSVGSEGSANSFNDSENEIDYETRIHDLEELLEFVRSVSSGYPSSEFERLIEAIQMAIKLRKFVRDDPMKSPQLIIDQVAKIKQRDRQNGVTCYVSLLIFEISKLSNVLDFPMLLQRIEQELKFGQRYLQRPIGQIRPNDISVEKLLQYYNEAISSLEIMGTDDNRMFMKVAFAMIEIRKAISQHDFIAAMNSVVAYDYYLQHSSAAELIEEEIRRLRIEMENEDAWKLISYGLKTGRCLDIIAIAKMQSAFKLAEQEHLQLDPNMESTKVSAIIPQLAPPVLSTPSISSFAQRKNSLFANLSGGQSSPAPSHNDSNNIHGSLIGRKGSMMSRRMSRRVSMGIQEMMNIFEQTYLQSDEHDHNDSEDAHIAVETDVSKQSSTFCNQHGDIEMIFQQYVETSPLLSSIRSSVYALKRAVSVTSRVSVKSSTVEYYVNATKIILNLREKILQNEWDDIRQIVTEEDLDLPPVAIEEINAVREGLLFQRCMEVVIETITNGSICGPAFAIQTEGIQHAALFELLDSLQLGSFQDEAAVTLVKLVKAVAELRKSFCDWHEMQEKFIIEEHMLREGLMSSIDSHEDAEVYATAKGLSATQTPKGKPDKLSVNFTGMSAKSLFTPASSSSLNDSFISPLTMTEASRTPGIVVSGMSSKPFVSLAVSSVKSVATQTVFDIFRTRRILNERLHQLLCTVQAVESLQKQNLPSLLQDLGLSTTARKQSTIHHIALQFSWMTKFSNCLQVVKSELQNIQSTLQYFSMLKHSILNLQLLPVPLLYYICYQKEESTKVSRESSILLPPVYSASKISQMLRNYALESGLSFGSVGNKKINDCKYDENVSISSALLSWLIHDDDYYFFSYFSQSLNQIEEYLTGHDHNTSTLLLSIFTVSQSIFKIRCYMDGKLPNRYNNACDSVTADDIRNIRPNIMELLHTEIEAVPELLRLHATYGHSFGFQEIIYYYEIDSISYQYATDLLHMLQLTAPKTPLNQFNIDDIILDIVEEKLQEVEDYLEMTLYGIFTSMRKKDSTYSFRRYQRGTCTSSIGIYEQMIKNRSETSKYAHQYYLHDLYEDTYLLLQMRHFLKDEQYGKIKEIFVENKFIAKRFLSSPFDVIRNEYQYYCYSLQFHDFHSLLTKKIASIEYDSYEFIRDDLFMSSQNDLDNKINIWKQENESKNAKYSFMLQEYHLFNNLFQLFDQIFSYTSPLLPTFCKLNLTVNGKSSETATIMMGIKTTVQVGGNDIIIGNLISVEYLQTSVYQLGCRIYRLLHAICIKKQWLPLSSRGRSDVGTERERAPPTNVTKSRVFVTSTKMARNITNKNSRESHNSTIAMVDQVSSSIKCPYGNLLSSIGVPDYYSVDPIFIEFFGLNQLNEYSSSLFTFYSILPTPPVLSSNTESSIINNYLSFVQHFPYSQESVFHILYFTNHTFAPPNIQKWFLFLRNILIEQELFDDLQYYTLKGCGKLPSSSKSHPTGQELHVPALYFQYLHYSIKKVFSIMQHSLRYSVDYAVRWSRSFSAWYEMGSFMYLLRQCVLYIQQDHQHRQQQYQSQLIKEHEASGQGHVIEILSSLGIDSAIGDATTISSAGVFITNELFETLTTLLTHNGFLERLPDQEMHAEFPLLIPLHKIAHPLTPFSDNISMFLQYDSFQMMHQEIYLYCHYVLSLQYEYVCLVVVQYLRSLSSIDSVFMLLQHPYYKQLSDALLMIQIHHPSVHGAVVSESHINIPQSSKHTGSYQYSVPMLEWIYWMGRWLYDTIQFIGYGNIEKVKDYLNEASLLLFDPQIISSSTTSSTLPLPTSLSNISNSKKSAWVSRWPVQMLQSNLLYVRCREEYEHIRDLYLTYIESFSSTKRMENIVINVDGNLLMVKKVNGTTHQAGISASSKPMQFTSPYFRSKFPAPPIAVINKEATTIPNKLTVFLTGAFSAMSPLNAVRDEIETKQQVVTTTVIATMEKIIVMVCKFYTCVYQYDPITATKVGSENIFDEENNENLGDDGIEESKGGKTNSKKEYRKRRLAFPALSLDIYRQLCQIFAEEVTLDTMILTPHWSVTLLLFIYYLREEYLWSKKLQGAIISHHLSSQEVTQGSQSATQARILQSPNRMFGQFAAPQTVPSEQDSHNSGYSHYHTPSSYGNTPLNPLSSSKKAKHQLTYGTPNSLPAGQESIYDTVWEESTAVSTMLPCHPSYSAQSQVNTMTPTCTPLLKDLSFLSHTNTMDCNLNTNNKKNKNITKIPIVPTLVQLLQEMPSFVWEYFLSESYSLRDDINSLPTMVEEKETIIYKNVREDGEGLSQRIRDSCEYGYYHPDITPNLIILSKYLNLVVHESEENNIFMNLVQPNDKGLSILPVSPGIQHGESWKSTTPYISTPSGIPQQTVASNQYTIESFLTSPTRTPSAGALGQSKWGIPSSSIDAGFSTPTVPRMNHVVDTASVVVVADGEDINPSLTLSGKGKSGHKVAFDPQHNIDFVSYDWEDGSRDIDSEEEEEAIKALRPRHLPIGFQQQREKKKQQLMAAWKIATPVPMQLDDIDIPLTFEDVMNMTPEVLLEQIEDEELSSRDWFILQLQRMEMLIKEHTRIQPANEEGKHTKYHYEIGLVTRSLFLIHKFIQILQGSNSTSTISKK